MTRGVEDLTRETGQKLHTGCSWQVWCQFVDKLRSSFRINGATDSSQIIVRLFLISNGTRGLVIDVIMVDLMSWCISHITLSGMGRFAIRYSHFAGITRANLLDQPFMLDGPDYRHTDREYP